MKTRILILMLFGFSLSLLYAQDKKEVSDPFDISIIKKKIDELGVPTVENVKKLKDNAYSLFNSGQWQKAASALNEYSRNANWIANLITSGLEPYYGASYDDRKNADYDILKPLIPLEKMANDYKRQRNEAMVMEAECYLKIGDNSKAVALLNNALDTINLKNDKLWIRARTNLYNLLGIKE